MTELFILVVHYVNVDSGDCDTSVLGAYKTFGQAEEELQKQMVEVQKDFEYVDTEQDNYVEGDMSWSIWEKGEFMSHHCTLLIECCELQ